MSPFNFDEAKSAHSQLYSSSSSSSSSDPDPNSTDPISDDFDPSNITASQHFHLGRNRDSNSNSNKPKLSHELLGGAVAFEAMHMWEKQQRREGRPVHHGVAKEALAALAAAEVDKVIERKGLGGSVDKEDAKRSAREKVGGLYDSQYGGDDMYDPDSEIHELMDY